ncbi:unnamed protein product [Blepharisma stoltei]|uniref:Calcium uniporter protein C-terminal domain-containing protein n=1 Tax=Blepharisma stoltei TaxID=1481888 RepID=A0AAU9INJ4_9CILI|nr:unnamed protein product [Blepharisma stoltei]
MLKKVVFKLAIPNHPIVIEFPSTEVIKTVADTIAAKGFNQVSFKSIDGVKISTTTKVSEILHEPYFIEVDGHSFKISPELHADSAENYNEFFHNLNLSLEDRHLLQNYVHSVSSYLNLASKETDKSSVAAALNKFLPVGRAKTENPLEIQKNLNEYHNELIKLLELDERIDKKAARFTNGVFWMGFGILSMQFAYIGAGTYVFYSWDIMEPQAYLITLANFITGVSIYAVKRQEFSMESMYDVIKNKRKNYLAKSYGLDRERLEFLKEEVNRLKKKLISD